MSDRIAVLSEGEVQQVGRPDDIYEHPRNRFVADFIGETNFLPARVENFDGDRAHYRIGGEQLIEAGSREGLKIGAEVTLSIRPERLQLVAEDTSSAAPCTVVQQLYLGTDLQYQVELKDGSKLTVRAPNSAGQRQRLVAGQRAGLLFEKGSASVLVD